MHNTTRTLFLTSLAYEALYGDACFYAVSQPQLYPNPSLCEIYPTAFFFFFLNKHCFSPRLSCNPKVFALAVLKNMILDMLVRVWETGGGVIRAKRGLSVWADYNSPRTKEISEGERKEWRYDKSLKELQYSLHWLNEATTEHLMYDADGVGPERVCKDQQSTAPIFRTVQLTHTH